MGDVTKPKILFLHTVHKRTCIQLNSGHFATLHVGMKTLPAVFSCCHHDVLELSTWAAHSTVNVSCSALHRCQQPGPAQTSRFRSSLLLSSQNQVAELLRLRHIVLEIKVKIKIKA